MGNINESIEGAKVGQTWKLSSVIGLTTTILLSACNLPLTKQLRSAVLPDQLQGDSRCPTRIYHNIFFAAPLCDEYPIEDKTANRIVLMTPAEADKQGQSVVFIAEALSDSRVKCQNFITSFAGAQAASNTIFDVGALVLTGLASVFTPANTVRALAAASTAVQGTKAAVNSDTFQQVTTLLLVQQIDKTYYSQVDAESNQLSSSQKLSASVEFQKIQGIHRQCSFLSAAASISENQQSNPPAK